MDTGLDLHDIHLNLGTKLIATYINLVLYSVELIAAYTYLSSERARRDKKLNVYAVVTNLVVDTISTFATCANIFLLLVLDWEHHYYVTRSHWTLGLWVITSGIGAFVVQSFMIYRYYRLSSNYIVAGTIILVMLSALSAHLYLGSHSTPSKLQVNYIRDIRAVTTALAASLATDISITIALTWKLLSARTFSANTKHLVRRVIAAAIMTGSVTSVISLGALISYLVAPQTTIATSFGFFLGRIYTLTMLFTLITRDKMYDNPFLYVDVDNSSLPSTNHPQTSGPMTPISANLHETAMIFAPPPSLQTTQTSIGIHSGRNSPYGFPISRTQSGNTIYADTSTKRENEISIA